MSDKTPVETFPPGDFIREELEARGWTQEVLAKVVGRSPRLVNEIITGKRTITAETAQALGDAFDTSAQLWMNLESAYRLAHVRGSDNLVSQRSRIYSKLPVNEIIKRGWIERTDNVEDLENRVLGFLEIRSLDETPKIIPHAARKSTSYDAVTSSQLAWLFRAKKLAARVDAEPYTVTRLRRGMERLKSLLRNPDDVRHVPGVLAESGVRFMVIEHLPKTRIDGCAFWLDTKSPVIVLSLRFDRIDCFWYTLIHDLYHIVHKDVGGGDEPLVDSDLVGTKATPSSERPANEQRADRGAAEFLVPQAELEEFIQRTGPRYSKSKIAEFADQLQVHPGLVVGQLQYRREISFSHSREMLVRIRDIITDSALTDGWGYAPA